MGTWVSVLGKWYAAVEKIGLTNETGNTLKQCKKCSVPNDEDATECVECKSVEFSEERIAHGDPYIYKGRDRAAMQDMKENGEEAFHNDPLNNEEMIELAHRKGSSSVEDYVTKRKGLNLKKLAEKNQAILDGTVITNRAAKASKAANPVDNTDYLSGRKNVPNGGFGDIPKV